MALVIEDGSLVADANSWVTEADADAYNLSRNRADWASLSSSEKEQYLLAGSAYVSNEMIYVFTGRMLTTQTNTLGWPRTDAFYWRGGPTLGDTVIPLEVKNAQVESAFLASVGQLPGFNYVPPGASGTGPIRREKLGELETEYFNIGENALGSSSTATIGGAGISALGHPVITGLLRPLLDDSFYTGFDSSIPSYVAARRPGYLVPPPSKRSFVPGMFSNPAAGSQAPGDDFDGDC